MLLTSPPFWHSICHTDISRKAGHSMFAYPMFAYPRFAVGSLLRATLVALLVTGSGLAQGLTGQISGTLDDSSGAAVVAEVVLLNQGTGQTRQIMSDPSGNLLFA